MKNQEIKDQNKEIRWNYLAVFNTQGSSFKKRPKSNSEEAGKDGLPVSFRPSAFNAAAAARPREEEKRKKQTAEDDDDELKMKDKELEDDDDRVNGKTKKKRRKKERERK